MRPNDGSTVKRRRYTSSGCDRPSHSNGAARARRLPRAAPVASVEAPPLLNEVRLREASGAVRLAVAAAVALHAGVASAGYGISFVRAGSEFSYALDGERVRIEEKGSPRVLVFDGKAMQYIEIDTEKRTWAVATLADAEAQGKALEEQLAAKDAALPPAEREQARKERRDRLARWTKLLRDTRFEPTGNQGMVADQICDGYLERVGGKVVAEGCYMPWSRQTIQKQDLAPVTRLAEFLNKAFANVEAAQGIDLRDGPLGRLARAPGFPAMRYDVAPDGKSGVQLKLTAFTSTLTFTPEIFRPPPDYTRLDRPASVVAPAARALRERAPVAP